VTVKDEDVTSDDVVGEGTFDISGAYTHPNQPKTCNFMIKTVPIEVYHANQSAGNVVVTVEWKTV
jgi:hypothetical protein